MQAHKEKWQRLCEQIVVEQDPTRFTTLVNELNNLLEEKERRLAHQREPDRAVSKTAS
jgi:hypothetical protein